MRKVMGQNQSCTLEDIEASASKTQTWAGAFLLFLPIVPIIATIFCIATYLELNLKAPASLTGIVWVDTIIPLLVGIILTLILWILLAFLFHRFTEVKRANEKSFYALMNHLSTLNYYIEILPDDKTKEVIQYRNSLCLALKEKSASWIVGNGYIELWDFMNSA